MAFYLLHNILFPVTKLANQHLLLDEFYRIEWTSARSRSHSNQSLSSSSSSIIQAEHNKTDLNSNISAQQEETEFISIHTILFGMSLVNFAFSHRCLNSIHNTVGDHRHYLYKLMLAQLVSLLGYLYTANTIASLAGSQKELNSSDGQPRVLHLIHGVILLIFSAVSQCSQFVVGSICDTLSVRAAISFGQDEGPKAEQQQQQRVLHLSRASAFNTQLMIGSFSVAFMSLSLLEFFIKNQVVIENKMGYTNIVLVVATLSIALELISYRLLTVGRRRPDYKWRQQGVVSRLSENKLMAVIDLNEWPAGANDETDARYIRAGCLKVTHTVLGSDNNRKSLPAIIWSISARNARSNSETTHSTDDDEFDNSDQRNRAHFPSADSDAKFRQANPVIELKALGGDVELFDRTKYSLYEDYELERQLEKAYESSRETSQRMKKIELARQQLQQQPQPENPGHLYKKQQQHESSPSQREHFASVFELLLVGDWPFVWQIQALILIGTVYQANQLCFLSEYLSYLLYRSPRPFRLALLVGANSLRTIPSGRMHEADTTRGFGVIWICLVFMSILAQNAARVVALQFANHIVVSVGTNRLLSLLLIVSLTIPVQFFCNYRLVETADTTELFYPQMRAIIVLAHIIIIQLLVGSLGALVEWVINELAVQYCQLAIAYRTTQILAPDRSDGSIQCTVHGLLNGSFLFIGTALMSALRILAGNTGSRTSSTVRREENFVLCLALGPIFVVLVLSAVLASRRWALVKLLRSN